MRRRRSRLEVSTFPFLAVLLCAMGSLILLLLVLDRRAKVVALAKARGLQLQNQKRKEEQTEILRRATVERERRQAEHHATLEQAQNDLQSQKNAVQERIRLTTQRLAAQRTRALELAKQLEYTEDDPKKTVVQTQQSQAQLEEAQQLSAAARAEMALLQDRLATLEKGLNALRAARQRAAQTYSVVPYAGRRGENRAPLYVECAADGLIFHPDKTLISDPLHASERVRTEVEQRTARQRLALGQTGTKAMPPYLMFLVRPKGTTAYYQALAALRPLEMEFGYEFIDPDWILDFPADEAPLTQPWMIREKLAVEPARPDDPRRVVMGLRPEGKGNSIWAPAPNTGEGQPRASSSGVLPLLPGEEPRRGGTPEGTPTGLPPLPGSSGPGGQGSTPSPSDRFPQTGESPGPSGPPLPPLPGDTEGSGRSLLPRSGMGNNAPGTVAQVPPEASGATSPPGAPRPFSDRVSSEIAPATTSSIPETAPSGSPGGSGAPGVGGRTEEGVKDSGEGEPGTSGTPRLGLPPLPGEAPLPTQPPRPIRYLGNRDWVIVVDCHADHVVLRAVGRSFPTAALAVPHSRQAPLLEAVGQMIARRQANVPQGEPPYRPQVRFLVRPDALRTYHLAYPSLEPLNIPLTRVNVDTQGGGEP